MKMINVSQATQVNISRKVLATVLFLSILFSMIGCGSESSPKSDTVIAPAETSTPLPPTSTPTLIPTDTNTIIDPVIPSQVNNNWQMIWQDEFETQEINLNNWGYEVNCFGGGNNEQQCYTDRAENAFIEQGVLKIVALKENFTGPAAQDDDPNYNPENTRTLPYTSARLRTKNKADWKYGRFEISAKLPKGQGTWPAIWMLPTDWAYGPWAGSGEIDIMEAVNLSAKSDEKGKEDELEKRVHGTLHYGRAWPENVHTGQAFHLPDGASPTDDFHQYAIEWQAGEIRWYVDNIHYATQTEAGWYSQYIKTNGSNEGLLMNGEGSAPFDLKFHLILNFAVGGAWPANVNEKNINEDVFPQALEIDYVRVYECAVSPSTGAGCETIGDDAILVEGKKAPEL